MIWTFIDFFKRKGKNKGKIVEKIKKDGFEKRFLKK